MNVLSSPFHWRASRLNAQCRKRQVSSAIRTRGKTLSYCSSLFVFYYISRGKIMADSQNSELYRTFFPFRSISHFFSPHDSSFLFFLEYSSMLVEFDLVTISSLCTRAFLSSYPRSYFTCPLIRPSAITSDTLWFMREINIFRSIFIRQGRTRYIMRMREKARNKFSRLCYTEFSTLRIFFPSNHSVYENCSDFRRETFIFLYFYRNEIEGKCFGRKYRVNFRYRTWVCNL